MTEIRGKKKKEVKYMTARAGTTLNLQTHFVNTDITLYTKSHDTQHSGCDYPPKMSN